MKRLIILWTLPVMLFCEVQFTLGTSISGNANENNIITTDETLFGGLFWEITANNLGLGMTYDLTFINEESNSDLVEKDWWIYWSATADFNYHFFGNTNIVDPFVGYSIGVRNNNKLYYYSTIESQWEETESGVYTHANDNISHRGQSTELIYLIGEVNGGLFIYMDTFFIGTKVSYEVMEMNIFQYYDNIEVVEPLTASFHVGFRF